MPTLFDYQQQVQRFLRDANQTFLNPTDLIDYINRARREVAMRAQCIRRLTPISGSIITIEVDNTDSNNDYSDNPTITITAPDFPSGQGEFPEGEQATANAVVNNGTIEEITVEYGGYGYFQPTVTITDPDGSGEGATAEVTELTYINQVTQGKEVYPFSEIDLSMFPGCGSVYMIKSVSLLFSQFRYSLACYDFSTYNSLLRQWSQQWQYVPAVCAQYGQGAGGSFYMYPIPSQAYQVELDCLIIPSDLTDNQSVEAIPAPWTDAVPLFAAHLSYLELQNMNHAKGYLDLFDKFVQRYSDYARVGRRINPYGRP